MARSWRGQFRERAVFEAGRLRGLSFFISTRLSKANWRRPAGTGRESQEARVSGVVERTFLPVSKTPITLFVANKKKKKLCGSASMHFRKKVFLIPRVFLLLFFLTVCSFFTSDKLIYFRGANYERCKLYSE